MTPPANRPLSPHLQVYQPQLTAVLSITHRATGVALGIGSIVLVWWLVAAATVALTVLAWIGALVAWGGHG